MGVETSETIPQLIHTATVLRKARRMRAEFLLRWALQRASGKKLSDDSQNCTDAVDLSDVNIPGWCGGSRRQRMFDVT
jgi:hypothetical protein